MIPSQTMADQVGDEIKVQVWVNRLRLVLGGALVVGLLGLGYMTFNHWNEGKVENAFTALYQAEKIEEEATTPPVTDPTKAAEAAPPEIFYTVIKTWNEQKKSEYVAKLDQVINEHSNTVPSSLAGLRKGNFYFHLGQFPEAQKAFEDLLKSFKPSSSSESIVYKAMAYEGLGVSFESQSKWDEALKAYQESSEMKSNPLKPLALLGKARVLRAQGKAEEAKPVFEQLIKDFPNTDYEKRARALMSMPTNS